MCNFIIWPQPIFLASSPGLRTYHGLPPSLYGIASALPSTCQALSFFFTDQFLFILQDPLTVLGRCSLSLGGRVSHSILSSYMALGLWASWGWAWISAHWTWPSNPIMEGNTDSTWVCWKYWYIANIIIKFLCRKLNCFVRLLLVPESTVRIKFLRKMRTWWDLGMEEFHSRVTIKNHFPPFLILPTSFLLFVISSIITVLE